MRYLRSLVLTLALAGVGCDGMLSVADDGGSPPDAGVAADGAIAIEDAGPPPTPDAGPGCEMPGAGSEALALDGFDDGASAGAAPALGLATFTVEAWIYREGRGVETGTGVGGVRLVPIAGKGRGERDGSNLDCNYAFGLSGDVLAADFEDMASGANHPVVGRTAIEPERWTHVAVSYDGATWRLYVDGALDAERTVDATPRADSIQHFGIGTAYDSSGTPAGFFAGRIDEVRVFDHARDGAAIAADRFTALTAAEGLVARWSLDAAEAGADTLGAHPLTITGATHLEGATIGFGPAPEVAIDAPADEAILPVDDASVALSVGEAPADVQLYLRSITEAEDFTVVVLPDTQYYTVEARGLHGYFYDQTRWVTENREAYNVVGVIHNGDIVNNADQPYQWRIADQAMSTLEEPLRVFPDGVPYGVAVGNHDQDPRGEVGATGPFNTWFGVDRFEGRRYYGGHYGGDNDQSWVAFQAGNLEIVVVSVEYDPAQDPAVTAWARRVFEAHPGAFGVLNAHYIVTGGGNFSEQGRRLYDALRDVPNLYLMTSGHVTAEQHREDTFEGHTIHSMVADYQGRDDGGSGYMRIWEFSPANRELTVRTYSPRLDVWETDANSEFTIALDLDGSSPVGAAFDRGAAVEGARGAVTVPLEGLAPGTRYEWYAEIDDCHHVVRTPLRRFTTAP